jgi:hypothetical protein
MWRSEEDSSSIWLVSCHHTYVDYSIRSIDETFFPKKKLEERENKYCIDLIKLLKYVCIGLLYTHIVVAAIVDQSSSVYSF